MCGIFGLLLADGTSLSLKEAKSLLDDLYLFSESRGKESAGLHVLNTISHQDVTIKESKAASQFIKSKAYHNAIESQIKPWLKEGQIACIAHSRLVTNGLADKPQNNQPVSYGQMTVVHNGIISNVDSVWEKHAELTRNAEVDTEVIAALLSQQIEAGQGAVAATQAVYKEIAGAASIAYVNQQDNRVVLATNTGDLFYAYDKERKFFIFASEKYILEQVLLREKRELEVIWLQAGKGIVVGLSDLALELFDVPLSHKREQVEAIVAPQTLEYLSEESLLKYNEKNLAELKRCTRCILPETFPYITFDHDGVCNYCHGYQPKYKHLDKEKAQTAFLNRIESYRRDGSEPDVIVPFSGGRDSSYGLHLIKKEFGFTPITFTYDWGMVTDLARRNIARICGQLGVQNILVSADIKTKRANIRKNVSAWLKQPELGMVPLFMAGDKHFFSLVNELKRQTGIRLDLWCANPLENTDFKSGFCKVAPDFDKKRLDYLSLGRRMKMVSYYAKNFATNPAYINSSLVDTFKAFLSYYFEKREDFYFMFDHMVWEENDVNKLLLEHYDWELSPDSPSTWRIGDGTAPFYNYIYVTAKGFSEFDTFRSNQIREGMIERADALASVLVENRPRVQSLRWYLETINLDFDTVIKKVNALDTLGLHS